MALKNAFTTVHGINLAGAYIRVEALRLSTKATIAFNVCIYADPTKPMVDGRPVECSYDLEGENPMEQAYAHLKTLPEFADAVDC